MDIKITSRQIVSADTKVDSAAQPANAEITNNQDVMENASRPNFFSGQLLAAQDLQQEQEYNTGDTVHRFWNNASAQTKEFLLGEGARLRTQLPQMSQAAGNDVNKLEDAISISLSNSFRNAPKLVNLERADIEAMLVIVMMEASKSAEQDLKDILGKMQNLRIDSQYATFSFQRVISKLAIEFPDLTGDTSIQAENIRAKEAIEYSHLLETTRLTPSEGSGSDDDKDD